MLIDGLAGGILPGGKFIHRLRSKGLVDGQIVLPLTKPVRIKIVAAFGIDPLAGFGVIFIFYFVGHARRSDPRWGFRFPILGKGRDGGIGVGNLRHLRLIAVEPMIDCFLIGGNRLRLRRRRLARWRTGGRSACRWGARWCRWRYRGGRCGPGIPGFLGAGIFRPFWDRVVPAAGRSVWYPRSDCHPD